MMKKFQNPEVEVTILNVEDIIATSGGITGGDAGTGSGTGSSGPDL